MKKILGPQQGEVRIVRIEGDYKSEIEENHLEKNANGQNIISHSESGNHHVLEKPVEVKKIKSRREGLDIFYAILDEPNALIQDAGQGAHEKIELPAGQYEFRISREYDGWTEKIRRVAD